MNTFSYLSKIEMKLELKKLKIKNIEETLANMTLLAFEEGSNTGNIKDFCFAIDIYDNSVTRTRIWKS